MRKSPGTYTRFVSITKVILPLIAIGLLATVFLFTKEQELEGGLKFSKADLAALATGLSIANPRFAGQNAQGDVYDFTAEELFPDSLSPSLIVATGLSGEIQYTSGEIIFLSANKAEFKVKEQVLNLIGDITIKMSDGTTVTSEAVRANLETGEVTSIGAVSASNAMGNISAGSFRLDNVLENGEENQMIWFENGVMLDFRPDSWDKGEASDE